MDVDDDDVIATVEDWDPIGQEMATYRVLQDRAQALPGEEYFLDVDGRLERHGGLGSLSEESSEEEEEESAADQPAEEPEDDSPEQVRRVEREPSDEVTDAVREVQRQAGLREELRGVERTWHRVLVEPGHR